MISSPSCLNARPSRRSVQEVWSSICAALLLLAQWLRVTAPSAALLPLAMGGRLCCRLSATPTALVVRAMTHHASGPRTLTSSSWCRRSARGPASVAVVASNEILRGRDSAAPARVRVVELRAGGVRDGVLALTSRCRAVVFDSASSSAASRPTVALRRRSRHLGQAGLCDIPRSYYRRR
jgi:hypothetical protein